MPTEIVIFGSELQAGDRIGQAHVMKVRVGNRYTHVLCVGHPIFRRRPDYHYIDTYENDDRILVERGR